MNVQLIRNIVALALWLFATPAFAQKTTTINVAVTIAPLHSIVSAIMADVGTPNLLLKSNQSDHHATLKPSQVKLLSGADVVFWVGAELETFLIGPVKSLAENAKVTAMMESDQIKLLVDPFGGNDPHIWLSIKNAAAIARLVTDQLAEIDPVHATVYRQNMNRFIQRLGTLEQELSAKFANAQPGAHLIEHNALRYFERQFPVSLTALSDADEDVAPSAHQIAETRALAQSGKYACLFVEPGHNNTAVRTAIAGSKIKIAEIDPTGVTLEPGAQLYVKLMQKLADTVLHCAQ